MLRAIKFVHHFVKLVEDVVYDILLTFLKVLRLLFIAFCFFRAEIQTHAYACLHLFKLFVKEKIVRIQSMAKVLISSFN